MISREQVEEMFENMRTRSSWDVNGVLLWGYFFTAKETTCLERASEYLAGDGYRCMPLYKAIDGATIVLHVERTESHTPETLHLRNCELESLAREFGLDSYDGMDVGLAVPREDSVGPEERT